MACNTGDCTDTATACANSANQPIGTTSAEALACNASVIDSVVNGSVTVVTRTGKNLKSLEQLSLEFGFGVALFDFATGGTLESVNLLVLNSDGFYYHYIGNPANIPLVIAPGFDPTASSDWEAFIATEHSLLSGRSSPDAHPAASISRGGSDVDADLTLIEADIATNTANIADNTSQINELGYINKGRSRLGVNAKKSLNGWGGQSPVSLLGDSISHGAFAGELYYNGYTRILARMFSAATNCLNYQGFVPMTTLDSGGLNESKDIHNIFFSGTWVSEDSSTSAVGAAANNGLSFRSNIQNNYISTTIPSFQAKSLFWYVQQPGGGEITIYINYTLTIVINTNGPLQSKSVLLANIDNGQGSLVIQAYKSDATTDPVSVIGWGYIDDIETPLFYNFSTSGRRLRYVDELVISDLANNASAFVLALGHNDQGDVDADPGGAYGLAFTQRIDWVIQYCNTHNTLLVVPDFCWEALDTSFTRLELQRAVNETNGIYIPFPNLFKSDGSIVDSTYLINTLGMWVDASHPNADGNKWIAETIAKYLGLTVASKETAIAYHDYWMPLDIPAGKNNVFTSPQSVSAYRLNGAEINFRYSVQDAPTGSFPVGTFTLSAGWRVTPPFSSVGTSLTLPGVLRSDTAITTSTVSIGLDGLFTISVIDGTWINAQAGIAKIPVSV